MLKIDTNPQGASVGAAVKTPSYVSIDQIGRESSLNALQASMATDQAMIAFGSPPSKSLDARSISARNEAEG